MAGPNDTPELTEEGVLALEEDLRNPNNGLSAQDRADIQHIVETWRTAHPKEAPQDRDSIEAQENAQRALYGIPRGDAPFGDMIEESSGTFFPPGKPKGYDEELTPDFDEATGLPNLTEWDDMQAFFEGLVPYGHEASTALETAIAGKPEHTALQKRRSQAGRLGDKVGDVAAATAMSVLAPATIPGQAAAGAGAALYGAVDDRYADPYTFLEYEKRSIPRETMQGAAIGAAAQGTANALQSFGRFGRDVVGRYGEKITDTGPQTLQRGAVESTKESASAQEAFERAALEAEQDVMTRGNSAQQSAQDASRYGSREGTGAQSRIDDGLQSSLNEAQKLTPQSTKKVVEGDRTYTKTEPGGGFDENINPMMDDEELQYALDMPIENVKDKIHDTGRTVTTETPESVAQSRGTTSTETRNQSNVASAHAEEFAERANQVAEAKTQMERQANSKRSQLGTTDSAATSASSESLVTGPSTDVKGPVTQTTRSPFYGGIGETWGNLADVPAAMLGKQPFPPAWMERNVGRFDWLDKSLPRVSDAAARIRERGFSPAVSATPYLAEKGAVFAASDYAGRAANALLAPAPTKADAQMSPEDPIQQSVGFVLSAYGDELDPMVADELTKAYIQAQQSGDVSKLIAADYNAQMNDANYRRMRRALLEGEDND